MDTRLMNGKRGHIARYLLTFIAIVFTTLLLIIPVLIVFIEGLKKGVIYYFLSVIEPAAASSVILTLKVALIVVPLNTIFGVLAAWLVTKFNFRGKTLLSTVFDIPFAVSPVIAGLVFVLFLGSRSFFGGILSDIGIKVIFSTPGIVLATLFVTFPFVVRELVPLMEEQGRDNEESAVLLGAGWLKTFFMVTLPNIKWGLIYGMILCNARAIGEFGAVSVVSGHIRGKTNTIPLHVEILFNEYNYTASFAVASLLVFIAIFTLMIRNLVEKKYLEDSKEA
jgi:sulfate transport system permease protein